MNPKHREERRAFKEALQARMRLVAAERNVPDADMKWIGRLRHEELVAFVRRHQLSWDWVLGAAPTKDRPHPQRAFHVVQGGLR